MLSERNVTTFEPSENVTTFMKTTHTKHHMQGSTSRVEISSDKTMVKKVIIRKVHKENDCYKREVHILQLLNSLNIDWCPQLLAHDDKLETFVMSYCGERMNMYNTPSNYRKQAAKILSDMASLNMKHNDIIADQVLILHSKVYLCDFGWASLDDDFACGLEISSKPKQNTIHDDTDILYFNSAWWLLYLRFKWFMISLFQHLTTKLNRF
jgi:hypothetical protein